jgi:2-methylisocitrate lyase-like PEP mutase family enzyme
VQHIINQQDKALIFHELHHNGRMLILPNIWNPLGALLLENIGYAAVATASAAIAYANGYDDGEHIPFDDLLKILSRIANAVDVPVTADIESGYSNNNSGLRENIKKLIETGIVGINIEDSDKQSGNLNPIEMQCERISLIRTVSNEMGIHLFINARTDVYIADTHEEKLQEAIKRGKAYTDAGADCLFPIAVKQKADISELVSNLNVPLNILAIPGTPDIKTLQEIGVARVSLGPGFLKIAVKAMKNIAVALMNLEGMNQIAENDITSDYLKTLVKTNRK